MSLKDKVILGLQEIRPFLKSDGGDISLVEVNEKDLIVKVKLLGNCYSCKVNQMTLKYGIEMTIKKYAPEIKQVIDVT